MTRGTQSRCDTVMTDPVTIFLFNCSSSSVPLNIHLTTNQTSQEKEQEQDYRGQGKSPVHRREGISQSRQKRGGTTAIGRKYLELAGLLNRATCKLGPVRKLLRFTLVMRDDIVHLSWLLD